MRSFRAGCLATALLALSCGASAASAPAPAIPTIDKAKLESFIRYTEGYTPVVKIAVDDPTSSDFPGFFRVVTHLTLGTQLLDKVYFVTPDGQRFVNGTVWDLQLSPFADSLSHLPALGPAYGPADAKVTVVVFSDFQCPYCREFAKTIREKLPAKYPKDVRVVFEDFPIASIHKWAVPAAEAGRCFAALNAAAFWAFHDWIFEHQGEITNENLKEKSVTFAQTQKLDTNDIGACIDSHAPEAQVTRSLAAGQALGVQQTPTFFINGRLIGGALPWNSLDAVIQLELNRPSGVPGPIAPKS